MNRLRKPSQAELSHSLESQKIEAGRFGMIFGIGETAKTNITALAVLLLLGSGVAFSFFEGISTSLEYWKAISPFITLGLGYIWGKNSG